MELIQPPHNAVELPMFWTWMGDDGVCRTKGKPGAEIMVEDAIGNSIAVTNLFKDKKFPLLVDASEVKSISKEARKHFSINGRETKITSFAIVVKSPVSRVIGNFFIVLSRPSVPAKLFDEESLAVAWLKTFL